MRDFPERENLSGMSDNTRLNPSPYSATELSAPVSVSTVGAVRSGSEDWNLARERKALKRIEPLE